jgi:hypothetical protein
MNREQSNALWDQLIAARDEFDRSGEWTPEHRPGRGLRRRSSPRAERFAEGLAFSDSWSLVPGSAERVDRAA